MAFATTAVNLRYFAVAPRKRDWFLSYLLRLEAWLDARASRRALYRLDDRALADLGLSAADLGRVDAAVSWQSLVHGLPSGAPGDRFDPRPADHCRRSA